MRSHSRYRGIGFTSAILLLCLLLGGVAHAAGTPTGTSISNTATTQYSDANSNSYSATSNEVTVSVTTIYRVEMSCDTDESGGSGSTVYFACTATNTSNDAATFGLSGSAGTALVADDGAGAGAPNDGIHHADETTATSSTGALAADGTYKFFLGVPIAGGTANGATQSATVTVSGNGATQTVTVTATAQTPVLSVVKQVRNFTDSGVFGNTANAKPDQELEYQVKVTNIGPLQATSVVLYDTLDANLDYVPGSLRAGNSDTYAGALAKTDTTSGDAGCVGDACATGNYNSGTRKVTFYLGNTASEAAGGTLNNSSFVYVYYHVKVK